MPASIGAKLERQGHQAMLVAVLEHLDGVAGFV